MFAKLAMRGGHFLCIDLMSQRLFYKTETKAAIQNGINLYRFDVLDVVVYNIDIVDVGL